MFRVLKLLDYVERKQKKKESFYNSFHSTCYSIIFRVFSKDGDGMLVENTEESSMHCVSSWLVDWIGFGGI